MLKDILNVEGAQELSKEEQKVIVGGGGKGGLGPQLQRCGYYTDNVTSCAIPPFDPGYSFTCWYRCVNGQWVLV